VQRLFAAGSSPLHAALSDGSAPQLSADTVEAKVATLGAVLATLGSRPALVGLAEVETAKLAAQVAAASGLGIECIEGAVDDELGFDLEALNISLLYDPDRFDPPVRLRSHIIDRTFDNRDVLEVHLPDRTTGRELCVLVNHWPSRLSLESADRRVAAGYYVRQLVADVVRFSARDLWDKDAKRLRVPPRKELKERASSPVVLMGDFNDEPFDRSLDVLNSTPERSEIEEDLKVSGRSVTARYTSYAASVPRLYNPTWELCTGGLGTYYRSPRWRVYDQILLSRGALGDWGNGRAVPLRPGQVMVDGSTISVELPSGRPRPFDENSRQGASDHFPIVVSTS